MRGIFSLILLVAIVFLAVFFLDHPGDVQMEWMGYSFQTTIVFLICTLLAVYLLFKLVIGMPARFFHKIFRFFIKDPGLLKAVEITKQKEKERYGLMLEAFLAIAIGDVKQAHKFEGKLKRAFEKNPEFLQLFRAQLAENSGDPEKALSLYREILKFEGKTYVAAVRGVLRILIRQKKEPETLDLYRSLIGKRPDLVWTYQEFIPVLIMTKDFQEALTVLDKGYKNKAFSKDEMKRIKSALYLDLADSVDGPLKKEYVEDAFDVAPTHPEAGVRYARQLHQEKKTGKAVNVLGNLWSFVPSYQVYMALLELISGKTPIEQVQAVEKFLENNVGHVYRHFVLADISFRAHLWGQAKSEMKTYLANCPTDRRALLCMADIEENGFGNAEDALKLRREAENLPLSPEWKCPCCKTTSPDRWESLCRVCGNYARFLPFNHASHPSQGN